MRDLRVKILIGLIAICFLFSGCAATQPAPVVKPEPPPVAAAPAAPERHTTIHPDGFQYEGVLDIAVLIAGDWGEPIWRNLAYMPEMVEVYYKNPVIGAEPQYACLNGSRQGIIGYSYMIGDTLHTFRAVPAGRVYVEFTPTAEAHKMYMDDYAKAIGHMKNKGV